MAEKESYVAKVTTERTEVGFVVYVEIPGWIKMIGVNSKSRELAETGARAAAAAMGYGVPPKGVGVKPPIVYNGDRRVNNADEVNYDPQED